MEPDDAADRAAARAARVVALGCMRHAMMSCRPQALLPHAHALMPVALATAACVGEPDLANAGRACAV
ncbi:hypothetical protein, partial [Klebsiella pneumoniae]|uniref:hypothetical protein n=1 Tax=Klebsiella pneumoniae TaxID=573 RepID=UPI0025A25DF4